MLHFAVFFKRSELFKPHDLPRRQIVDFIKSGRYFGRDPLFKPSANSSAIDEPQWFTLDVQLHDPKILIHIQWLPYDQGYRYTFAPMRRMAQAMAMDDQESLSRRLLEVVAESTDAIAVHVESDQSDASGTMLDDLQKYLLDLLDGVLFVPGKQLRNNGSALRFPHEFRQPRGTLTLFRGGGDCVVAVSPDGKSLATAGGGNKAGLWDAQSLALKTMLIGHKKATRSTAFSPDGGTVATGSEDKSVILWNVATGTAKGVLLGHTGIVATVAFSPSGDLLASGDFGGTTILWNVPEGTRAASISSPGKAVIGIKDGEKWHSGKNTLASVCSVTFSPDGKLLATGGGDDAVSVYDVASGTVILTLRGYAESAWPVVFSPDGLRLAAGSYDRKVRIWDLSTGELIHILDGHADYVFALAFAPDGKTLATGSSDTLVRLWDIGGESRRCTYYGCGHTAAVSSVAFSPDGDTLVSASDDGTVRLWSLTGDSHDHQF